MGVLLSPHGRVHPVPAEGAAQATIAGAAPQAAGTEVVVAVEQAGVLVGLVAEQADQRVAIGLLQLRAAPQWGENASGHLWGREKAPCHPLSPTRHRGKGKSFPAGPVSWCLFLGYELHGTRLLRTHPLPRHHGLGWSMQWGDPRMGVPMSGASPGMGCPPVWVTLG